jgi:hypothetical protein
MKRSLLLLLLSLLTSFSAFAASVTSIAPALGTVGGGDTVVITVDTSLQHCPVCSPPSYVANVTFDGVPARSLTAWDKTIWAVTPAHARGTVQVVVTSRDFFQNTEVPYGTAQFTFASWGDPIEGSNYERILVPLALSPGGSVPGAFGSQWTGELYARNRAAYAVELFNDVTCTVICPPIAFGIAHPALPADSLTKISPTSTTIVNAYLYYLQKTYASDVDFSLHIANVSRSSDNAGTEIGVVRERDFRGTSFDILNVPIDGLSRATLRVYDPSASDNSSADVAIYSMTDGKLIATTNIALAPPAAKPPSVVTPAFAGFGQIGDIRNAFAFAQGSSFPIGRVRINVTMRRTDRGWAFVSVTNNATQLITTYKPE